MISPKYNINRSLHVLGQANRYQQPQLLPELVIKHGLINFVDQVPIRAPAPGTAQINDERINTESTVQPSTAGRDTQPSRN